MPLRAKTNALLYCGLGCADKVFFDLPKGDQNRPGNISQDPPDISRAGVDMKSTGYFSGHPLFQAKAPDQNAVDQHCCQRRVSENSVQCERTAFRTDYHARRSGDIQNHPCGKKTEDDIADNPFSLLGEDTDRVAEQGKSDDNAAGNKDWFHCARLMI